MDIITLDFESHWAQDYSLTKLSPLEYVLDERWETISCSIKVNHYPTDVFFGHDKIAHAFKGIKNRVANSLLIAHNMSGFDAYVCKYIYGLEPRMWGCTLAMARPRFAKTVGLSLSRLVEHFGIGKKNNTVLMQTKGKHLEDFTPDELEAMKVYNREDTDQCYVLFNRLKPMFNAKELWQIDALIRMRVEPQFTVNTPMLEAALSMERDRKRKHVLMLGKHLRQSDLGSEAVAEAATIEALEEALVTELASAPKFAKLLKSLDVEVPMKISPSQKPDEEIKWVPALAKSDEAFLDLQEHENEIVAAAARARLSVKSTIVETRIQKFLTAARLTGGLLPIPLRYCGADTTGRDSGEEYNPQNLPRVNPKTPKVSDALRNCVGVPKGYKIGVADLSGIELRVNHFLWKVPSSMALFQDDPEGDLYKAFASERYGVAVGEVSKDQRQMGKVAHLGLGFGAGSPTFRRFAKTQYGLVIDEAESDDVVAKWRHAYEEIVHGWKACQNGLNAVYRSQQQPVDPWGMVITEKDGFRLPSGRLIYYPDLRIEDDGKWPDGRPKKSMFYASGRHKARITGPKADENIVQALARDVLCDYAIDFFKVSGFRPKLRVHDELVYVFPESEAHDLLATLQAIMRTPPKWWPELVTWSEGDVANTYGAAK